MNSVYKCRIMLVINDELVANRFTQLTNPISPTVRFNNVYSAEKWLTNLQDIDLILIDDQNVSNLVAFIRRNPSYKMMPILVVIDAAKTNYLNTAVTDVIGIYEEDYDIKKKIHYYIYLNDRLQATSQNKQLITTQNYRLPWWKRSIDITVSLIALLILSPLLLLVALLIVINSKGPALYKSKRVGTNFYIFNMYKFRTMNLNADKQIKNLSADNIYSNPVKNLGIDTNLNGISFLCEECRKQGEDCRQLLINQSDSICEKIHLDNKETTNFMKFRNDPRITKFGRFLRNSSIDELPQLLNILIGDMSLVGNRPLPLYEAEKLTSDEFVSRFSGPAGLTGLWQIEKRAKGDSFMSDKERISLDIIYATTFSFKKDIRIIWRTLFSLWQKENV